MTATNFRSVKEAERVWHNNWYDANARREYPETAEEFRNFFARVQLTPFHEGGWAYWGDARAEMTQLIGDVAGLKILDYGCGSGQFAIYLAMLGAEVSGFDLSPKAIDVAKWAALKYGVNCSFDTMDAEELEYPDNSFDLVVGFGVLHHVIKYPNSSCQLRRVLKSQGKAFFHETLWDNSLINFVRKWTTEDDEAGDAHLTQDSIRRFGRSFAGTSVHKRHLLYMLKRLARLPNRNLADPLSPRPVWKAIRRVDQVLARLGMAKFCGEAIIVYTQE